MKHWHSKWEFVFAVIVGVIAVLGMLAPAFIK